jgi:hypothetical protein
MIISIPVEDVLRWGWAAAAASGAVWDPEGMDAISARNVQLIRDAGPLAELPQPLTLLGLARAWMGDFAGATSLVAEAEELAAATRNQFAPYTALRLRALEGNEAEAAALIASAIARRRRARWNGICARCSPSSASTPGDSGGPSPIAADRSPLPSASTHDPCAVAQMLHHGAAGGLPVSAGSFGCSASGTVSTFNHGPKGSEARIPCSRPASSACQRPSACPWPGNLHSRTRYP